MIQEEALSGGRCLLSRKFRAELELEIRVSFIHGWCLTPGVVEIAEGQLLFACMLPLPLPAMGLNTA